MERKINLRSYNPLAYILIYIIKVYQFLTPWLNCCRFYPSCSEYSIQAIRQHGVISGLILTSYRILRCNPYCKPGFDPVPLTFDIKSKIIKVIKRKNV